MPRQISAAAWLARIHKKCTRTNLPRDYCQQVRQSLTGSCTDPPPCREVKDWAGGSYKHVCWKAILITGKDVKHDIISGIFLSTRYNATLSECSSEREIDQLAVLLDTAGPTCQRWHRDLHRLRFLTKAFNHQGSEVWSVWGKKRKMISLNSLTALPMT